MIHGAAIPVITAAATGQTGQSREVEAPANTSRAEAIAEERELAQAAQGGCMESFEQLVSRFEGQLFHFLLKKTGDHHLSQDLLQTTFVIAYRKLHRFNPEVCLFNLDLHHRQPAGDQPLSPSTPVRFRGCRPGG